MNERKRSRKDIRNPLKNLDRQAYRRAFGEPDAEFHDRVRDTLFLIREKEEAPVKKKMTFSMAFALVMCICIAAAAFAGSLLPVNQPDNTFDPLSQSQNTPSGAPTIPNKIMPTPTPMSAASDPLYYRSSDMGFYHRLTRCFGGEQSIPTTEYDINRLCLTACPYCVFDTVYVGEGSVVYHKTADCTAFGNHKLIEVDSDGIWYGGKIACPICIASSCIFWQEGSEYTTYHLRICDSLEKISDHSAAVQGTVAEALACGRELCESCKNSAVFYSPESPYTFHVSNWSWCALIDAVDAEWIPLSSALSAEITGCVRCMDGFYYCSAYNGFYHVDYGCSALGNAELMLLSEEDAVASGRVRCSDCKMETIDALPTSTPMPTLATIPPKSTITPMPVDSNDVTVYLDDGGAYYHTDYKCLSMTNPKKWQYGTVAEALNMGRTSCPTCMYPASEPRTVYFTENGSHYHTDSTCMGMKNSQPGTVAQALNLGKTACPTCINVSPTPVPVHDSTLVYMTDYNGIYYHYDENCMNMVGAYYTTFDSMRNGDDRPPCPLCTFSIDNDAALVYVWSKEGESHYHTDQFCGGTLGKNRMLVRVALNRRQTPCPTCIASEQYTQTYYYRTDGTFYHADKSCGIVENCELLSGSLTQVKALGRTPCPNCYEPSSADITYYAAPSAYSYHTQFTCASTAEYHASGRWIDRAESAISFEKIFDPLSSLYLQPCTDCVENELTIASMMRSGDETVPMMRDETMDAPGETPRSIVVNALDFDGDFAGACYDLAVDFSCDILTVHSTVMMHSRGALYTEFEFTLKDPTIHPDAIRIIPYGEEHGSPDCLWTNVQQITYDNGEIGYLLCQMMDSPSLEYDADRFILYSGDVMLAEFK